MGDPDWRARAFTTVEGALSPQHRNLLFPLFQQPEPPSAHHPEAARRREERLIELGLGRYAWVSPWVRACALRQLDSTSATAAAALKRAEKDPDSLVAETAVTVLRGHIADRYTTIEKVLVLRKVGLFREVPYENLAGVATVLTDRWVEPGERIIEKGELGDCLYVIESGRVRVQDGDRFLSELGTHQAFGELSLLDAEPRSASVFAVERSHLFALAQADFYPLVSERPDITQAINRVLCQMVRKANASERARAALSA